MSTPATHRLPRKTGRKPTAPPPNAVELVRDLAADGFSIIGVAARMGVSKDTFYRWLDDDPDLKDAFDLGRENERWTLHNLLYRQAVEQGNATAAMFLLKARHGYKEGDQSAQGSRVNVNIALPGAMTLQQFNAIGKGSDNEQ